jgi:hypothetical protein
VRELHRCALFSIAWRELRDDPSRLDPHVHEPPPSAHLAPERIRHEQPEHLSLAPRLDHVHLRAHLRRSPRAQPPHHDRGRHAHAFASSGPGPEEAVAERHGARSSGWCSIVAARWTT